MKKILNTISGYRAYDEIRILGPIRKIEKELKAEGILIQKCHLENMQEKVAKNYDITCIHGATNLAVVHAVKNIDFCFFCDDLMWNPPAYNPVQLTKAKLKSIHFAITNSKSIIATTQILKDKISWLGSEYNDEVNKKTIVCPNVIDEVGEMNTSDNILYAGGNSHAGDIQLLNNYKLKNKLVFFAHSLPRDKSEYRINEIGQLSIIPKYKNIGHIETVPNHDEYTTYINNIDFGVGLCPLVEHEFNNCKSIYKYLEYAKQGAISVLSDTLPYSRIPNEACVKVKNDWNSAITYGIKNREDIYKSMKQWVNENYVYGGSMDNWVNAYRTM